MSVFGFLRAQAHYDLATPQENPRNDEINAAIDDVDDTAGRLAHICDDCGLTMTVPILSLPHFDDPIRYDLKLEGIPIQDGVPVAADLASRFREWADRLERVQPT